MWQDLSILTGLLSLKRQPTISDGFFGTGRVTP